MITEITDKLETKFRASLYCKVCGMPKSDGAIVCWDCFKYRENAFKHSDLSLKDWLKSINYPKV